MICAQDSIHLLARDAVRLTAQPSIDLLRHLFSVDATLDAGNCVATGVAAREASARALDRGAVSLGPVPLGLTEAHVELQRIEYAKTTQLGSRFGATRRSSTTSASVQVELEILRGRRGLCRGDGSRSRRTDRDRSSQPRSSPPRCRRALGAHGDPGPRRHGVFVEVDLHFYMNGPGFGRRLGRPHVQRPSSRPHCSARTDWRRNPNTRLRTPTGRLMNTAYMIDAVRRRFARRRQDLAVSIPPTSARTSSRR